MRLLSWYLLLFVLAIVNFSVAVAKLKSFLAEYSSIRYVGDLSHFKSMVRVQMYSALLQIVILGAALVIGVFGILNGELSLITVLALNGVIMLLGKLFKGTEEKARLLPVDDKELETDYRDVCRAWKHKPFPDF